MGKQKKRPDGQNGCARGKEDNNGRESDNG
jgi:hypothetical protein